MQRLGDREPGLTRQIINLKTLQQWGYFTSRGIQDIPNDTIKSPKKNSIFLYFIFIVCCMWGRINVTTGWKIMAIWRSLFYHSKIL